MKSSIIKLDVAEMKDNVVQDAILRQNTIRNGIALFIKRFIVILSIICISMAANANEESDENQSNIVLGLYVGGSVMKMSSEYYIQNILDDLPGDYDKGLLGVSYGVKAGYDMYFLKEHGLRFYVDYMHSYFNSNDRTLGSYSMHTIGINTDYRFVIMDSLSVFAGAGLAHNIIDTQHLGSMNAFGGSLNVGLSYILSLLEFEFRVRYLIYDLADKYSSYLPTIMGQQTRYHIVELNSPVSFHLGINFRF